MCSIWFGCLTVDIDQDSYVCSGSDAGSMIEPIVAIPLNDELQGARALVVRAELEALSKLTDKVWKVDRFGFAIWPFSVFLSLHLFLNFHLQILLELDNIQILMQETVTLDKVLLLFITHFPWKVVVVTDISF